jgi:hypothetical protein
MAARRPAAAGGERRQTQADCCRLRDSNTSSDQGVSNKSDIFALFATGPPKLGLYKQLPDLAPLDVATTSCAPPENRLEAAMPVGGPDPSRSENRK